MLDEVLGARARGIVASIGRVACLVAAIRFWHCSQLSQYRATTLYYGRRFAGWLSTIIIGIDEPTGVVLLPNARFIGGCEVVLACSDELPTV
jgi:hypothetical protein